MKYDESKVNSAISSLSGVKSKINSNVQKKYVENAYAGFYKNNPLGQFLDKYASKWFKSNSVGSQVGTGIGQVIGNVVAGATTGRFFMGYGIICWNVWIWKIYRRILVTS